MKHKEGSRMSRTTLYALVLVCTFVGAIPVCADNWPQWRGPDGDGVSRETDLPLVWTEESGIAWKCKLPGPGNSTPAIWGDAVFVTCQLDDGKLVLLRIDKSSGQMAWTRPVGVTSVPPPSQSSHRRRRTKFHDENNMASPTPATDGQTVVAHFGNGDLAAYDFDGKQLWHRNLQQDHGSYTIWWGHANSPVICDKLVISVCMQDSCRDLPGEPAPSYVVAHDLLSGEQRWKTMRMTDADAERGDSYATPILHRPSGRPELVVIGGKVLDAYDPRDGRRLWHLPGLTGNRVIPSPVAVDGIIYANTGFYEGEALLAVKVAGLGERPHDDIVWRYEQGISDSPSPVVWGEQL
ncbi:MAG: PQQ-binding-like beta-propeller repeat protein, partial [Planctomycetota bacterium]